MAVAIALALFLVCASTAAAGETVIGKTAGVATLGSAWTSWSYGGVFSFEGGRISATLEPFGALSLKRTGGHFESLSSKLTFVARFESAGALDAIKLGFEGTPTDPGSSYVISDRRPLSSFAPAGVGGRAEDPMAFACRPGEFDLLVGERGSFDVISFVNESLEVVGFELFVMELY